MKKRILLSLVSFFMMTAMWASLQEAYQIYVTAGANGKTGQSATLTLNMKNTQAIWSWTATVALPEGVTYVDGSLALDPARLPEFPEGVEPTITATVNEDGTVTFACQLPADDQDSNGIYDYAITGTDGAIATFNVAVASTVTPGDVQVVVNANTAIMVEPNGTSTYTYQKANSFTWTIEEGALLGDVNMDGAIDIADVNKVLELMATSTKAEDYPAGDVNGDGGIDIADVNKVLEIMASQTGE